MYVIQKCWALPAVFFFFIYLICGQEMLETKKTVWHEPVTRRQLNRQWNERSHMIVHDIERMTYALLIHFIFIFIFSRELSSAYYIN